MGAVRGVTAPPLSYRFLLLFIVSQNLNVVCFGQTTTVLGAGSTFGAVLVNSWLTQFQQSAPATSALNLTFLATGSGAGIQSLQQQTVQFSFTEAPLSTAETSAMAGPFFTFPSAIGAVGLSYNIPDAQITGSLNLTASIISKIFQGTITSWNDAEIAAINPGLTTSQAITVVVRGDASGTTYALTDYLTNAVGTSWALGKTSSPVWPNTFAQFSGNDAVISSIQSTNYSIGYVRFNSSADLKTAQVQNSNGNFVPATTAGIMASAAAISSFPGFDLSWSSVSIVNQAGAITYPISTFTYVIVYKDQISPGPTGTALVAFLKYIFTIKGQSLCSVNYLLPIPESLRQSVFTTVNSIAVSTTTRDYFAIPIKIGSLFSNTSSNSLPAELEAAFRIACEYASNSYASSSSSISLQCATFSDASSVAAGGAVGVVGDLLSQNSQAANTILSGSKITQISPASTSSSLTSLPYFFRTVSPDNNQPKALVSLLNTYGWRQVAILSSTSAYAQAITGSLVAECAAVNITVLTSQSFAAGIQNSSVLKTQMGAISNSGATIIILSASQSEVNVVMQAAQNAGLTAAGYGWLSVDPGYFADFNLAYVQGLVALNPKSGTGSLFETLKSIWASKDASQYPGVVHTQTQGPVPDPSPFSGQTFDAVYAFVTAINSLASIGADPTDGQTLYTAIKNVNFTGTTGIIGFQDSGELNYPIYNIVNVLGNKLQYVGTALPNSASTASLEGIIVWPGGSIAVPTGKRNVIFNLGGVFPTNPTLLDANPILYDLGIELQTAFRIACEVVNSGLYFQNARFNCLWAPTAFDRNSTIIAAQTLVNNSVIGIVGSVYSETSEALATYVAGPRQLPQISPSASAKLLSNKTAYPYFLRMSPSEQSQVLAIATLTDYFGWKQVATLGVGSSYFLNTVSLFVTECNKRGIKLTTSQSLPNVSNRTQVQNTLQAILDSGSRVIFLNAFIQDALVVFEEAAKLSMTQKGWVWIGSPQTTLQTRQAFVSHESAKTAMYGMISIRPTGGVGSLYDFLMSTWKARDPIQYPGILQQGFREPITWSPETFDAVFAFAYAVENALLQNLDPTNGAVLMNLLRNTNFTGATGANAFDINGDPLKPAFDIVNFRDGLFEHVGIYVQTTNDTSNSTFQRTGVIVWPGGQLETPADHYVPPPPVTNPPLENNSLPGGVLILLVLLALVAVLAVMILVWIWRKEKSTGKGFFTNLLPKTNPQPSHTRLEEMS